MEKGKQPVIQSDASIWEKEIINARIVFFSVVCFCLSGGLCVCVLGCWEGGGWTI